MSKYSTKLIDECGYEPRDSFPYLKIKKEICDLADELPAEDFVSLFKAISSYHWEAKKPDNLTDLNKGIFISFKPFLDDTLRKHILLCKTNSISQSGRWEKIKNK